MYIGGYPYPYSFMPNSVPLSALDAATQALINGALQKANNLNDVANKGTSVTNLGAVHIGGDTMTGSLTAPGLCINNGAGYGTLLFNNGANTRWSIFKDNTAETGSTTGSNFQINAWDDGGTQHTALSINRASQAVSIAAALAVTGLSALNGGLNVHGYTYADTGVHITGVGPVASGQGGYLGWNESGQNGEMNFTNNKGGGAGGMNFRQVNANNTTQDWSIQFDGSGNCTGMGNLTLNQSLTVNGGNNSTFNNCDIWINNQHSIIWNYNTAHISFRGDQGMGGGGFINNGNNAWLLQIRDNGNIQAPSGATSFSWGDSSNMGGQYNGTGSNGGHCENPGTICIQAGGNQNLHISKPGGYSQSQYVLWWNAGSAIGSINCNGSSVAYNTTSDYRLKENVQDLTGSLNRIAALHPIAFTWTLDGQADRGFIAHELAEQEPYAVSGKKDAVREDGSIDPQQVDLSKLIPDMVAAMQELIARVATLEAQLGAR